MNVALFFIVTLVAVASALPSRMLFHGKEIRPQIVGGEQAGEKEFPYFVSIWLETCIPGWVCLFMPGCGGVIYDETRIITSAFCASLVTKKNAVVAGNPILNISSTYEQRHEIASILSHENYSSATNDNDIAILTLTGALVYNDAVQPLRLAEVSSTPSGDVAICGYGDTVEDAFQFKKATLGVISNDKCQHDFESVDVAPPITENMVCAEKPSEGVSRMDLGGPMVAKDEAGSVYLAGISSWGVMPVGIYPSVFADIAHLRPWLESKLNP